MDWNSLNILWSVWMMLVKVYDMIMNQWIDAINLLTGRWNKAMLHAPFIWSAVTLCVVSMHSFNKVYNFKHAQTICTYARMHLIFHLHTPTGFSYVYFLFFWRILFFERSLLCSPRLHLSCRNIVKKYLNNCLIYILKCKLFLKQCILAE